MNIDKITPVLVVEAIEPCLPLWTEQLGFEKTAEVPHGDRLGFVILVRDGVEMMLQTLASCRADDARLAEGLKAGDVVLYATVSSLEDAQRATGGLETLVPERRTFYGAREIFVRTPDGHRMGFSEHGGG